METGPQVIDTRHEKERPVFHKWIFNIVAIIFLVAVNYYFMTLITD